MVIDWNNIARGCFEGETVALVARSGTGDLCPSQFWLDVYGLGVIAARGGEGLVASLGPASDPTSRQSCERLLGQITAAEGDASGSRVVVAEVTHGGTWAADFGYCEAWEPASVALAQLAPEQDSLRLFAFAVEVRELPILGQLLVQPIEAWLRVESSASYPECIIE